MFARIGFVWQDGHRRVHHRLATGSTVDFEAVPDSVTRCVSKREWSGAKLDGQQSSFLLAERTR